MSHVEDGTRQDAARDVAACAERSFADHVVEQVGPGEWRCAKPGTGIDSFRVISRPGVLIVYGDIGDAILHMGAPDPMKWASGAVGSPGYFFEKMRMGAGAAETFYVGDALEWLTERRGESSALEEAKELAACGDLHPHTWAELLLDHGFDSECCHIGHGPTARMFWILEAVKWLCRAVKP